MAFMMKNLERIVSCSEGKRCNYPLSCEKCGENWRRAKFKAFAERLPFAVSDNAIITYIVIKANPLLNLHDGIEEIYSYIDKLREAKKRGKLPTCFCRLEVSFGKKNLGFNPHLNIISFHDKDFFIDLAKNYNLTSWYSRKDSNKDTILSIAWYILKFNKIGIEKGEAVRKALKKRNQITHSKEFNHANINYIDEFIDIDFSFMGVYPIRTKEEIELRKKLSEERRKLNKEFRDRIELAKKKFEHFLERGAGETFF